MVNRKKINYFCFLIIGIVLLFVVNMLRNMGANWIPSWFPIGLRAGLFVFGVFYFIIKGKIIINTITVSVLLYAIFSVLALFFWWDGEGNIIIDTLSQNFSLVMFAIFCIELRHTDRNNTTMEKTLFFAFCVFLVLFMLDMIRSGTEHNAFVNNVYYLLVFVPISFSWTRNRFVFTLVLSAVSVLVSGKRTAFIALVCAIIIPLLFVVFKKSNRNKILALLAFIVALVGVLLALDWINEAFDIALFERFESIGEDGGSGRIDIYQRVWNEFKSSSVIQKLFGHGYNAVANDKITYSYSSGASIATSAHNDFLEILYDYGLFALVFYVLFLLSLFSVSRRLYKTNNKYANTFLSALIVFVIMSSTSHLILYPTYIVMLFFAFACGVCGLNKQGEGLL